MTSVHLILANIIWALEYLKVLCDLLYYFDNQEEFFKLWITEEPRGFSSKTWLFDLKMYCKKSTFCHCFNHPI